MTVELDFDLAVKALRALVGSGNGILATTAGIMMMEHEPEKVLRIATEMRQAHEALVRLGQQDVSPFDRDAWVDGVIRRAEFLIANPEARRGVGVA